MKHHVMQKALLESKKITAILAAITVMLFFFSNTLPAYAQGVVQMSTAYPGISANPGSSVTFDLDFSNLSDLGELVSLSQNGLPDGWTGEFEGNGNEISSVYAKSGENEKVVSYHITIPDEAKKGLYTITLNANGNSLPLSINVTDENTGSSQLTTDYAAQEGPGSSTFTYTTTIQNNSSQPQTYSLTSQAPKGWTLSFSSDNKQVSSIDVDAHNSKAITVTVTPPDQVNAGDYEIPIGAVSSDQNLSTTLKVTITGTYKVSITTSDGTLSFNAHSAKREQVLLNITNDGNIDLTNLNLTSSAPSNWKVDFSESTIDTLEAGQTKSVTMYVTPSNNAVSGDYQMTLTASNSDTSANAAFRVTVKTGTAWGIIGIIIIAGVIALMGFIFHKFGRH